jgi:hypothetical protein
MRAALPKTKAFLATATLTRRAARADLSRQRER